MKKDNIVVRYFQHDPWRFRIFSFFSGIWLVPAFFWQFAEALRIGEGSRFIQWNVSFFQSKFWLVESIASNLARAFTTGYGSTSGGFRDGEGGVVILTILIAYAVQMLFFGLIGLAILEILRLPFSIYMRIKG